MARVLHNNTIIEYLDIGQCCLRELGFLKLWNGLANVNSLKYLSFAGNKIPEFVTPKI